MGHTLANRYTNGKTESNPGTRAGIKKLERKAIMTEWAL